MIKTKKVYPYVDSNGTPRYDLDYHYGVRVEYDELGNEIEYERYKIRQVETGIIYDEAVDLMPCRYTYEPTDEPIVVPSEDVSQETNEEI